MADHTHGNFMGMPFLHSVEEVPYEKRFARSFPRLRTNVFYSTTTNVYWSCGCDHVRKENSLLQTTNIGPAISTLKFCSASVLLENAAVCGLAQH